MSVLRLHVQPAQECCCASWRGARGLPGFLDFSEVLLVNDSLGKKAMRKTKRTRVMRPRVSSSLNVGTVAMSITDADVQKTLNHKMAKRQRQPNHQLRTRPLPRPSRAGLSKCRLTISTIIRVSMCVPCGQERAMVSKPTVLISIFICQKEFSKRQMY